MSQLFEVTGPSLNRTLLARSFQIKGILVKRTKVTNLFPYTCSRGRKEQVDRKIVNHITKVENIH